MSMPRFGWTACALMPSLAYMPQGNEGRTAQAAAAATIEINGYALREVRNRTGVSANKFAQQINLSQSYLSRIENGQRTRISPEVYTAILKGLGVTDQRTFLANPHIGQVAA